MNTAIAQDTALFAKLLSGKNDFSFDLQDFCLTNSDVCGTDNCKVQRLN